MEFLINLGIYIIFIKKDGSISAHLLSKIHLYCTT